MLDLVFVPAAALYLLVIGLMLVYGFNFFYLTFIAHSRRNAWQPAPPLENLPRVTVQLPVYNEMYVASRLILAAAKLDYPADLLEIQVLDDSTDETTTIVAEQVAQLRAAGLNIQHLQRNNRLGFKSGALAHGLALAEGEYLAIFDADFLPTADFLRRTLPYFQDQRVGFVQARWGHVNRDYSLLTQLQSLAIDAHFMVEQFARSQAGHWFNFNGTAGVWRREAIEAAGGWKSDTLTEDLDLSYRAFLSGWRGYFLRELEVPAELPVSFSAYRRQQHRWARGSLECAMKYIPSVWRSRIPIGHKLEATLHLLGYGVHLLMCVLGLLYPFVLLLSQQHAGLFSLFGFAVLFNASAMAPTIFFLIAQLQLGNRSWALLPMILFISAFGAGMMLNTVRAALEIVTHKRGVFERTPKFGIVRRNQDWRSRRYQLRLDPIVFFELGFALLNLGTAVAALHLHNWGIFAYALLFSIGLFFTSGLTIIQALAIERSQIPVQNFG
ncbi:MAG TPA: cellulose synthase family protein [Anaerolineales bacterium]|nr:cellulose synthase family protein [Anaerolineales bacterium]